MTSNSPQPAPEWPEPERRSQVPASSEPLEGLPLAEDGFPAPDGRWHTGPLDPWQTGPQGRVRAGGRWPATRAPWPGQASDLPARLPERGTGEQVMVAAPEPGGAVESGDERLATLSYLSVPFLGPVVPLVVYLIKKRASAYVRRQSVQALNLSITALIYTFCALIVGAMLALDSITVALIFVVPLAVALWLVTLSYVILAASRASRGDYFRIPGWLCTTILR